jgi:Excalibur calcium-binding domain
MQPYRRVAAVIALAAMLTGLAPGALAADRTTDKAAHHYKNCASLNKVYPHGVGRSGAKDHVSGSSKPVKTFKVSTKVYNANTGRDRDKDGIACEKK